jgi:rSAM/selenodomain-associated transferase 2
VSSVRDVGEIIVVDCGSDDHTVAIARSRGARTILAPRGRGAQMAAGANAAQGEWLLFLHADTVLEPSWHQEAEDFMFEDGSRMKAAVFRFALDEESPQARRLEWLVAWRVRSLALPYGDQGLLIHRDFYRELGGFRPLSLMEDVDFVRRIGGRRLTLLRSAARTSAARWRRDGWTRRSVGNLCCLTLYFMGVPPAMIGRLYG